MPIIWIIGFRGTGKTTVGQRLAAALGLDFVDTDRRIQEIERMSIADIFQKRGEMHFRIAEEQVILQLATMKDLVVAVGGGACGREASVTAMRASGTVVLLTADLDEIERRLARDETTPEQRPPLTDQASPREEIAYLLKKRESDYQRAAHITLDTTLLDPNEAVHVILKELRRRRR